MCRKDTLGQGAGFEQSKAQQDGISQYDPDAPDNVICVGDVLYQNRIDTDTDHNQKALEAQCKKRPQVVLSSVTLLPIAEGGEGDWGQAGDQIDLNHTAINNDEDDR